jgi:MFS family permease
MVLGVTICAMAFTGAFFVDPGIQFGLVAALVLLATFAMALFDTTADGYAIEVMPAEDYTRVQSVMTSGRASGLIILSFVFGLLAARFGYSTIFLAIALILLLPLVMLLQIKEPAQHSRHLTFDWRAFKVFGCREYILFAVFLISAWFTFQGIDGLVTFYMSSKLGVSEITLGSYGTLKGIGMVIGAVGMSLIAGRFGLKAAGLLLLVLVSLGGLFLGTTANPQFILAIGIAWGIVVGLQWTVYATMAMGITDLRIAGSMFALFQMMANIGIASGEGIATSLSDNLGFSNVFLALAAVNLILIPFFLLVSRQLKARESSASAIDFTGGEEMTV